MKEKFPNNALEDRVADNEDPARKKGKKPIFKKWWFWLIIIAVIFILIIMFSGGGDEDNSGSGGSPKNTGTVNLETSNTVENLVEYTVNKAFVTEKIKALMSSYSYSAEPGNEYVVIDTNVKNLTSQSAGLDDLMTVTITIDGKIYNADDFIVTNEDIDSWGVIEALENSRVYFAAQVPKGSNKENMILTVKANDKISSCEISISKYEAKKKQLPLGKEIADDNLSATVEKVYFAENVKPPKPGTYSSYYAADDGKTFLTVKIKVKNLKGSNISEDSITGINCVYNDKYNYSGYAVAESAEGDRLDTYESIKPLETRNIYYLIEVPKEVENGPAELEIYICGETYYYQVK